MNFRSIADLNHDILANLHRIPKTVDVVVGIPRSGLMAASLVALALNLPLADVDGFAKGRILASGITRRRQSWASEFGDLRHALVLDDSINSGGSMALARETLASLSSAGGASAGGASSIDLTYGAIYGVEQAAAHVDLIFEIVPQPRVFEWNVMHHEILGSACVDIDGVLCADPTHAENDDGAAYINFLNNARPFLSPTRKIGTLVTSRLEKYRPQTEAWLERHGIEHERLVMLDLPDAATRRRLRAHAGFKGDFYRNSASALFIESEVDQAREIANISGKDVLCIANQQMVRPGALSRAGYLQRIRRSHKVRMVARAVLGEPARARIKSALSLE